MIYLFSDKKDGALRDGADLMEKKNRGSHPGLTAFYLEKQDGSRHRLVEGLGPTCDIAEEDCELAPGEVAIVIGHGGPGTKLMDDDEADVTEAAVSLLGKIAGRNADKTYSVFVAACDGATLQSAAKTSLLAALVEKIPSLATRVRAGEIACWGYTAVAGVIDLDRGVPDDKTGFHIYGRLQTASEADRHCGYDTAVTAQLKPSGGGTYAALSVPRAPYKFNDVADWYKGYEKDKGRPGMERKYPELFKTLAPTR